MRILILGGSGMLGHQLWKQLHSEHEVWVTLRRPVADYARYGLFDANRSISGFDAANQDHLVRAFQTARPEAVVNCIGIIKQLKAAQDPIPSLNINALFPHRIAQLASLSGARVVQISTDCVFNGLKGNYSQTDPSDAEDLYGRSKFLGELDYPNALTIRSSIIGHELESQVGLIEWFLNQSGRVIKGFKRAIYSGFSTIEMSRIIERVLVQFPGLHGVWQVSSSPISKFDLLLLAKKHYQMSCEIIEDESFVCDRSLNSAPFRASTGYAPPSWEEMISELARERMPLK
jgi:dTDP-4-dehydrorhamnose reductase